MRSLVPAAQSLIITMLLILLHQQHPAEAAIKTVVGAHSLNTVAMKSEQPQQRRLLRYDIIGVPYESNVIEWAGYTEYNTNDSDSGTEAQHDSSILWHRASEASSHDDNQVQDATQIRVPFFFSMSQGYPVSLYVNSNGFVTPSEYPLCPYFCSPNKYMNLHYSYEFVSRRGRELGSEASSILGSGNINNNGETKNNGSRVVERDSESTGVVSERDQGGSWPTLSLYAADLDPSRQYPSAEGLSGKQGIYFARNVSKPYCTASSCTTINNMSKGVVSIIDFRRISPYFEPRFDNVGESDALSAQIELWPNGTVIFKYKNVISSSVLEGLNMKPSVGLTPGGCGRQRAVVAENWTRSSSQNKSSNTPLMKAVRFEPLFDPCASLTTCSTCTTAQVKSAPPFSALSRCIWCRSRILPTVEQTNETAEDGFCVHPDVQADYCSLSDEIDDDAMCALPSAVRPILSGEALVMPVTSGRGLTRPLYGQRFYSVSLFRSVPPNRSQVVGSKSLRRVVELGGDDAFDTTNLFPDLRLVRAWQRDNINLTHFNNTKRTFQWTDAREDQSMKNETWKQQESVAEQWQSLLLGSPVLSWNLTAASDAAEKAEQKAEQDQLNGDHVTESVTIGPSDLPPAVEVDFTSNISINLSLPFTFPVFSSNSSMMENRFTRNVYLQKRNAVVSLLDPRPCPVDNCPFSLIPLPAGVELRYSNHSSIEVWHLVISGSNTSRGGRSEGVAFCPPQLVNRQNVTQAYACAAATVIQFSNLVAIPDDRYLVHPQQMPPVTVQVLLDANGHVMYHYMRRELPAVVNHEVKDVVEDNMSIINTSFIHLSFETSGGEAVTDDLDDFANEDEDQYVPIISYPYLRAVGISQHQGLFPRHTVAWSDGASRLPGAQLSLGSVVCFNPIDGGCPDCGGRGYCDPGTLQCRCLNGYADRVQDSLSSTARIGDGAWANLSSGGDDGPCSECKPGYFGQFCSPCACGTEDTCDDGRDGTGRCISPDKGPADNGEGCCSSEDESHCFRLGSVCQPTEKIVSSPLYCNPDGGDCVCGRCECRTELGWYGPGCRQWEDPCWRRSLDGCSVCTDTPLIVSPHASKFIRGAYNGVIPCVFCDAPQYECVTKQGALAGVPSENYTRCLNRVFENDTFSTNVSSSPASTNYNSSGSQENDESASMNFSSDVIAYNDDHPTSFCDVCPIFHYNPQNDYYMKLDDEQRFYGLIFITIFIIFSFFFLFGTYVFWRWRYFSWNPLVVHASIGRESFVVGERTVLRVEFPWNKEEAAKEKKKRRKAMIREMREYARTEVFERVATFRQRLRGLLRRGDREEDSPDGLAVTAHDEPPTHTGTETIQQGAQQGAEQGVTDATPAIETQQMNDNNRRPHNSVSGGEDDDDPAQIQVNDNGASDNINNNDNDHVSNNVRDDNGDSNSDHDDDVDEPPRHREVQDNTRTVGNERMVGGEAVDYPATDLDWISHRRHHGQWNPTVNYIQGFPVQQISLKALRKWQLKRGLAQQVDKNYGRRSQGERLRENEEEETGQTPAAAPDMLTRPTTTAAAPGSSGPVVSVTVRSAGILTANNATTRLSDGRDGLTQSPSASSSPPAVSVDRSEDPADGSNNSTAAGRRAHSSNDKGDRQLPAAVSAGGRGRRRHNGYEYYTVGNDDGNTDIDPTVPGVEDSGRNRRSPTAALDRAEGSMRGRRDHNRNQQTEHPRPENDQSEQREQNDYYYHRSSVETARHSQISSHSRHEIAPVVALSYQFSRGGAADDDFSDGLSTTSSQSTSGYRRSPSCIEMAPLVRRRK